jgi:uncharacterized membrane protein YgaE (UPF0421/DUF939 family)
VTSSKWTTTLGARFWPALVHSSSLAAACVLTYWVVTELLAKVHSVSKPDDMIGGLWAVIATAFVYRWTYQDSHKAALSRISASLFSFALCFVYLLLAPFHLWALALLIGVGALVLALLGRMDDIATCTIATAVVMIIAALSPHDAWEQPILRLADTIVGVAFGLGAAWIAVRVSPREMP